MEKVSIIVPVYNAERYIEKCIRSILDQSYSNLEIIIINDGSSDRSLEILEKMAVAEERILLISQKNCGVSAARNQGLQMSSGKYLTFVDGDDYLDEKYIEEMVSALEEKSADMVIAGLTMVDELGKVQKTIVPREYVRFEKEEWTFRISAVAAHLYKRSLWEAYNMKFCEGVRGEDMPVSLFFSAICDKITTVCTAGYFYVQHSSSAMHNFRGLSKYQLPYEALENTIKKVQKVGIRNSREYFELFVIRILATFIDLARGAGKDEACKLDKYIMNILSNYFPEYNQNTKIKLNANVEVPYNQKIAVWVLVKAVRYKKLSLLLKIMCR